MAIFWLQGYLLIDLSFNLEAKKKIYTSDHKVWEFNMQIRNIGKLFRDIFCNNNQSLKLLRLHK